MPDFPTLDRAPDVSDHVQGVLSDPVWRSEAKSGAALSQARTTAPPRTRTLYWPAATKANKITLEDWERDTIGYAGPFVWTDPDPDDNQKYVAHLAKPISYRRHSQSVGHWQIGATLILTREVG